MVGIEISVLATGLLITYYCKILDLILAPLLTKRLTMSVCVQLNNITQTVTDLRKHHSSAVVS